MQLLEFCKARHGAAQRLAESLGVSGSLVVQWAAGKQVPIDRCAHIERVSDGAVTCEDLRPDRRWHRLPDDDWRWHPSGRPLLDVALTGFDWDAAHATQHAPEPMSQATRPSNSACPLSTSQGTPHAS